MRLKGAVGLLGGDAKKKSNLPDFLGYNSMIEDQICDGDLVVIEGRREARNGETVVALVDGDEATLKRFYRSGSDVKLVPANSTMQPMEYHASQVEIRGVVRGLMRSF